MFATPGAVKTTEVVDQVEEEKGNQQADPVVGMLARALPQQGSQKGRADNEEIQPTMQDRQERFIGSYDPVVLVEHRYLSPELLLV